MGSVFGFRSLTLIFVLCFQKKGTDREGEHSRVPPL